MDFEKIKNIRHKKELAIIGTVLICVLLISIVYYNNVVKTGRNYKEAVSYYDEYDYKSAQPIFEKLGDYKDSKNYVELCSKNILENDYNHAISLYQDGEYKQAIELLEEMPDYNGSKQLLEQCKMMLEYKEEFDRVDPQNAEFYKIVKTQIKKYGKPEAVNAGGKSYTVIGVNLLELIDFNGDGINELVIGRRTSAGSAGEYEVYAYYGNAAHKVYSAKYSKSNGTNLYALKVKVDDDGAVRSLYAGNESSGKHLTFDGFKFNVGSTWKKSGKKYTVNGKAVSGDAYYRVVASDAMLKKQRLSKPLKDYTLTFANVNYYSTSYMTYNAASVLSNRFSNKVVTLKESYDRIAAEAEKE